MKIAVYFAFALMAVSGCTTNTGGSQGGDAVDGAAYGNDTIPLQINVEKVKSDVDEIDSLMIIKANGETIFSIAMGGNTELIAHTLLDVNGNSMAVFTIADYFQNDQIFYMTYNLSDSTLCRTEHLYLPYIGMVISEFESLDSIAFSGDSLRVQSKNHAEAISSLALDTIRLSGDKIINYYEFE